VTHVGTLNACDIRVFNARDYFNSRPLEKREKGIGHGDARAFARSAFVVPCKSSALMPRDSFSIVVDAAGRPCSYVTSVLVFPFVGSLREIMRYEKQNGITGLTVIFFFFLNDINKFDFLLTILLKKHDYIF